MLVTLLAIVIEIREEQLSKAQLPMFVTLSGIMIEVREEQAQFMAHIDNQRVTRNTVKKSYR